MNFLSNILYMYHKCSSKSKSVLGATPPLLLVCVKSLAETKTRLRVSLRREGATKRLKYLLKHHTTNDVRVTSSYGWLQVTNTGRAPCYDALVLVRTGAYCLLVPTVGCTVRT